MRASGFGKPAIQRFHPRHQFRRAERFCNVIVCTVLQSADFFRFLGARGEHNNAHGFAFFAQAAAHLEPVDAGKHHVQQYEVVGRFVHFLKALRPVRRDVCLKIRNFQVIPFQFRNGDIIFNDQDIMCPVLTLCI